MLDTGQKIYAVPSRLTGVTESWKFLVLQRLLSLQKHAYTNILKILQPKMENFR